MRTAKQYAFKFKSPPEELDVETQILADNEFYKLPTEKLLTGYNYIRPDVYNYSNGDIRSPALNFYEIGNLGYLALKTGKNPLNLLSDKTDIDLNDYVTIVPFQDEIFPMLKARSGNYTDIIEVWEIHLDLINGSKKTLRYTSFEDFLLVLIQSELDGLARIEAFCFLRQAVGR